MASKSLANNLISQSLSSQLMASQAMATLCMCHYWFLMLWSDSLKFENAIKNWIWLHHNFRMVNRRFIMYGEFSVLRAQPTLQFWPQRRSPTFCIMKLVHWINNGHLEPKTRKYLKSWPRTGYGMAMTSLTALNQRAYSNTIESHRPCWVLQTKEFTVVWGRSTCSVLSVQT